MHKSKLIISFICSFRFSIEKFDHFSQPRHGYDNVDGDLDSPSYDEVERPPLRQIDKYVRAEMFGLSARYTVSVMAMLGFIISFGMRCNMGMAKLEKERESGVSFWSIWNYHNIPIHWQSKCPYHILAFSIIGLRLNRPRKMNEHMKEVSAKSDKNRF